MSLPTSSLTLKKLVIEIARKIGVAYYGADGTEVAQPPENAHDLDECIRHANNAVRMFLADAPSEGWRFTRPVANVSMWGTIGVNASNLITSGGYDPLSDKTTLNVSTDSFYATMEGKDIALTGVDTFAIANYVSARQIKVSGDATNAGVAGVTWSMTADGNYTLPRNFGGELVGDLSYAAGTNVGVGITWEDESTIRQWRADITDDTGDPWMLAMRPTSFLVDGLRRWEVMAYPTPDEVLGIEFPFILSFDAMVDLDEYPPVPFPYDNILKAACLAIVEKDVEGVLGNDWQVYNDRELANARRINNRAAPKRLGYVGNPGQGSAASAIRIFRSDMYQRPTVTFS